MTITCKTHGQVEGRHIGNYDFMCPICWSDACRVFIYHTSKQPVPVVQTTGSMSARVAKPDPT